MRNASNLFPLGLYTDPVARRQAISTYVSGVLLAVAAVVFALSALLVQWTTKSALQQSALLIGAIVLCVSAVGAVVMTRRGEQNRAGAVIITAWIAMAAAGGLSQTIVPQTFLAVTMLGISLSATLVGLSALLYMAGATLVLLFAIVATNLNATRDGWIPLFLIYIPLLLVHTAINYLLAQNPRGAIRQVESVKQEQQEQLSGFSKAITEHLLASRVDLSALSQDVINLLRDGFANIDHAQLYLVDADRTNVTLVATTADAAETSVENAVVGQKVGIGTLGIIGRVTLSGQAISVRDTDSNTGYRRSAFLPGTRTQLAIPLRIGSGTIGVVDLQSKSPDAFPSDEVHALETVANQIAIAVDNARLYADLQERSNENQRFAEQTRNNLREIERLNQQLVGGAWAEYLRSAATTPAFTIDRSTGQVQDEAEWTPTLAEASRRGQPIIRESEKGKVVALPFTVRGQVVGAMEFELGADQTVHNEQLVMLQQVMERLGLAAENVRLLEEAQRRAQREALVNEISARLQATPNVDAVIAAATQSLADAFQAPRVAIRLGNPGSVQSTSTN